MTACLPAFLSYDEYGQLSINLRLRKPRETNVKENEIEKMDMLYFPDVYYTESVLRAAKRDLKPATSASLTMVGVLLIHLWLCDWRGIYVFLFSNVFLGAVT